MSRADQRADTPRTAAGRKLLNYLAFDGVGYERHRKEILAIEAEAAADSLRSVEPAAAEPPDAVAIAERVVATIEGAIEDGAPEWLEAAFNEAVVAEAWRAAQPPRGSLPDREPIYDSEGIPIPDSTWPALDVLMNEHRLCSKPYEGCYAHWPMDHCRADGMAWPCDVDRIRARLGSPEDSDAV